MNSFQTIEGYLQSEGVVDSGGFEVQSGKVPWLESASRVQPHCTSNWLELGELGLLVAMPALDCLLSADNGIPGGRSTSKPAG